MFAHGYRLEILVPPLGSLHLKIAPGCVLVSTPKFQSACESVSIERTCCDAPSKTIQTYLIEQLIDVEVNVPISANTRAIGPQDARIANERVRLAVAIGRRVVEVHSIVLRHQLVHEPIVVTFEAIGIATSLAVVADIAVS
jgi:hypothetical protein